MSDDADSDDLFWNASAMTEDLGPHRNLSSVVWVWMTSDCDGRLEEDDCYPSHVAWYEYEIEAEGVAGLIDGNDGLAWLLEHGIAPGQNFIVRIEACTYHQDHEGDWDIDYGDWEVLWIEPMHPEEAARRWTEVEEIKVLCQCGSVMDEYRRGPTKDEEPRYSYVCPECARSWGGEPTAAKYRTPALLSE